MISTEEGNFAGKPKQQTVSNPLEQVVRLELWNHGTAGETVKPCGEVDVFNVTGTKINQCVLESLMSKDAYDNKFDWFGGLPTETVLQVDAEIEGDDGDIWMHIKNWKELEA